MGSNVLCICQSVSRKYVKYVNGYVLRRQGSLFEDSIATISCILIYDVSTILLTYLHVTSPHVVTDGNCMNKSRLNLSHNSYDDAAL